MKTRKQPVEVKYQTLIIVWAALLMSQLFFLALVYFIKPELFPFDFSRPLLGDQPLIVIVFALMAIILFGLSFVFRNQHMARAVADQDASCVQTGLVLGCALSEGCSLLGVILAFVFEYHYFFIWIGLGLLGILLHFPRKGNLNAARYKRFKTP